MPFTAPARTAAMLSGFAGGAALAGPVGLLRRSGRAFVDTTINLASGLSLTLGGVDVQVLGGAEYLTEARPCVFIFNHRSNLDAFVLMNLLQKDITAVAKRELADIPGFGQFFRMADVAFIDRSNSSQAREAIQPAIDKITSDRISLVMAPEGTRWRTPGLGTFKKGAFHIAAQAGVPVVPIVMAGNGELLPPGTPVVRSGTVKVEVLPPVDVSSWEPGAMDACVAEVRRSMLHALVELIAA
jgi:putative phosphoserine phosphatase/1-acylglycerol-3-phosphate O-acyltransferase